MPDHKKSPHPRNPARVFDVVRPSDVHPYPTSRPVLHSNQPKVVDPMIGQKKHPLTSNDAPQPETQQSNQATNETQSVAPAVAVSRNRRWRIMLSLVIGIIVLFVIADLLIDAGVVHTTITPLTHFFHHS